MGKIGAYLEIPRAVAGPEAVAERLRHYREFYRAADLDEDALRQQAARCLGCGVPHCHAYGCPLGNLIPEWNDLVYRGRWREACERLHSTNNFPEFTGRICPAPCEAACVIAQSDPPNATRQLELAIVERGFAESWIRPLPPAQETGKRVAVVGSGPAGLAAAQQLRRAGHEVTVFERADRVGGLLRYGIPDFKLEKWVVDRRLEQLRAEGVSFRTRTEIGRDISSRYLQAEYDAVCLCGGAGQPRDLRAPGRELAGIHFAVDYLAQQNRRCAGAELDPAGEICAEAKHVVVIGGGDTGSDCIGTAWRQGARSVVQLEILPEPPAEPPADTPWPLWPQVLRTSPAHEEGCERRFSASTTAFKGDGRDRVTALQGENVETGTDSSGRLEFVSRPGSAFELPAELVLLALGFTGPRREGMLEELGIELDARGKVKTDAAMTTSVTGVFAAGDMRYGQSLVTRAIAEGRRLAHHVDLHLMGETSLPAAAELPLFPPLPQT